MSAACDKFMEECEYGVPDWRHNNLAAWSDSIPCYGFRITVNDEVNTEDRINKLLRYGPRESADGETMFFFSVTKRDACWDAWAQFAKDNPNKFAAVVETKSRHRPTYPVRLYIYVKKPRAVKK